MTWTFRRATDELACDRLAAVADALDRSWLDALSRDPGSKPAALLELEADERDTYRALVAGIRGEPVAPEMLERGRDLWFDWPLVDECIRDGFLPDDPPGYEWGEGPDPRGDVECLADLHGLAAVRERLALERWTLLRGVAVALEVDDTMAGLPTDIDPDPDDQPPEIETVDLVSAVSRVRRLLDREDGFTALLSPAPDPDGADA